jgi:hypothetical protein
VPETRAASALNHPNIVAIYEIDSVEGVDFIAMEYAEGKTVYKLIGRKGWRRMASPPARPWRLYHCHQSNGMKIWEPALFAITPEKLYMLTFEAKGNIWAINVGRE